jgi:drug/metabolite transporter (DMT)-like permease
MIYLFVLVPPIIFAITNLIDKRLTVGEEDDSSPSALMLIGGTFNLVVSIPIFIYLMYQGSFEFSLGLFLNGIVFSAAIWLYLWALCKEDTDRVLVWYQTIPIFGIFGAAVFLGEHLDMLSIFAIILVFIGALVMSSRNGKVNYRLVAVMLISAALIAVNDVAFAYWGRDLSVANALFSDITGKAFWCLIFIFDPRGIKGFITGLKTKFFLQSGNELLFVIGDAALDVAKLFAPVAIVQAMSSTQVVFVFIGGLILITIGGIILGLYFV